MTPRITKDITMKKLTIAALAVIAIALTAQVAGAYQNCNTSCYGNSCTTTCY